MQHSSFPKFFKWLTILSIAFILSAYVGIAKADTNVAKGRPVTVSSESAPYLKALGVDGDLTTRWSSAYSDPQVYSIDLGASFTLSRVLITWENAYGKNYSIDLSPDGVAWNTGFTVTNNSVLVNDLAVSGTARFVRLSGTARGTVYGYSIKEFEVYGSPVVAPPVTSTPYVVSIPIQYPFPFGTGSDYKLDTVNPRGGNVLLQPAVSAWWYNDSYLYTCYGLAGDVKTWAIDKAKAGLSAVASLVKGDRKPMDALFTTNVVRALTPEEATLRDDLCSLIPKQPLVYVVNPSGATDNKRPAYTRNPDGTRNTTRIGYAQVLTQCNCARPENRIKEANLYCSVAGSPNIGTSAVLPDNAVTICVKQ